MFDEEHRDEHDECRFEIERQRERIERLVSAFKQVRADLALSSGTWSNAASFGLYPEDIGLKRIEDDSPAQETGTAPHSCHCPAPQGDACWHTPEECAMRARANAVACPTCFPELVCPKHG